MSPTAGTSGELRRAGRYNALVPTETEVKYRVPSFEAVRSALTSVGAECEGEVVETDTFFDTPGGDLRRGDRGLRLRSARPADGGTPRGLLTYKGPRDPQAERKVREEIESPVGDVEALGEVLRACGLEPTLTLQKRRRRWRLGGCEVALDELPLLGTYVEIEGPSGDAIEHVRERLGLAGEPITTPYFQLLADRCPRAGGACRRATFDTCPNCEHAPPT
jgi:adenylate cyclase class 2